MKFKTLADGSKARVSYRKTPANGWEGLIKNDLGEIVHECGHSHRNRDFTTVSGGTSAQSCARAYFKGKLQP